MTEDEAEASVHGALSEFLEAIMADRLWPRSQDIFDRMNAALILMVAYATMRHQTSQDRQDAYLQWLIIGVENVLKNGHGVRQDARPNPLALPGGKPS